MDQDKNQDKNAENAIIRQPLRMKGSKFVVGFVIFGLLVSVVFCYSLYQSFLNRPKIKIEDEVK